MLNKNVSLNDFFHSLQHVLHPVHIIKNTFAAEKIHRVLTKLKCK
jgi:hypothetical protein